MTTTNRKKPWKKWGGIVAAVVLAYWLGGFRDNVDTSPESVGEARLTSPDAGEGVGSDATIWTCAMHPQIRMPAPGQCPICGMDLVPLDDSAVETEERRLVMSPAEKKLAEIQTALVEKKYVDAEVRLVGSLELDETRVRSISAYVPGRIDKLYINYTGIPVRRGDHLADLYSPELLTAQQELLEANRRVAESTERSEFLRNSDARALQSAREKLRLLGFAESQIEAIEKRGKASDHMLITSPSSGIVVHKMVNEGDYVKTGTPIYTVAELDRLWVLLDAYESDLRWLHYGQPVDLQAEAFPGEHFSGTIAFIDPVLDAKSRTTKLRVNVDNPDGRLKPGMFVRATVHSRVASGGRVMDPMLAGKWISPMHPEIVRDEAGDCPVCGMALIRAEELGYVTSTDEENRPLIVPASAVLKTGRRAVVYVEVAGMERPTYEGREVALGPRAGDYYLVAEGLQEGERVVTNGNFNIDSALQIRAKPSMMSVEPAGDARRDQFTQLRPGLEPVYDLYFQIQDALASDELERAVSHSEAFRREMSGVELSLLKGRAQNIWLELVNQVNLGTAGLETASSIEQARASFRMLSDAMLEVERSFGHGGTRTHFEVHCPMAFGDGASWLQPYEEIRNPFYGSAMLDCGSTSARHLPVVASDPRDTTTTTHQH